jgi:GTPase SAR1 family protein
VNIKSVTSPVEESKMSRKTERILTLALIGDSKVGKSELFRYLSEQCQEERKAKEGEDTSQLTISVSVKEFKQAPNYPRCPDVVHFFRSESKEGTISVRTNHTRKYWPTVAPVVETFNISGQKVTIFDVSGNPEFCRLAYVYEGFRNVDGFVLCYDMTSKESFDNLVHWHKQYVLSRDVPGYSSTSCSVPANGNKSDNIDDHVTAWNDEDGINSGNSYIGNTRSKTSVPFVVVGTKADYEEGRKVAHGTVAEFCDISPGTRFFETSARVPGDGAPIFRVFEDLVQRCTKLKDECTHESYAGSTNNSNNTCNNDSDSSVNFKKRQQIILNRNERGCADNCSIS